MNTSKFENPRLAFFRICVKNVSTQKIKFELPEKQLDFERIGKIGFQIEFILQIEKFVRRKAIRIDDFVKHCHNH